MAKDFLLKLDSKLPGKLVKMRGNPKFMRSQGVKPVIPYSRHESGMPYLMT